MRQQVFISAAADDFPEKVDVTERSREGEIQTMADCFSIPRERQIGRCIAQARDTRCERVSKTVGVRIRSRINQINIICRARGTVHNRSDATHENEIDAPFYQHGQELLELHAHLLAVAASIGRTFAPARRRLEVKRIKFANFERRSAGVSLRFSRNNVRSTSRINSPTRSVRDPSFSITMVTKNTTLAERCKSRGFQLDSFRRNFESARKKRVQPESREGFV